MPVGDDRLSKPAICTSAGLNNEARAAGEFSFLLIADCDAHYCRRCKRKELLGIQRGRAAGDNRSAAWDTGSDGWKTSVTGSHQHAVQQATPDQNELCVHIYGLSAGTGARDSKPLPYGSRVHFLLISNSSRSTGS